MDRFLELRKLSLGRGNGNAVIFEGYLLPCKPLVSFLKRINKAFTVDFTIDTTTDRIIIKYKPEGALEYIGEASFNAKTADEYSISWAKMHYKEVYEV